MEGTLYKRFIEQGTISEPKGIPDPRYALPSTVHWMRAYSMIVKSKNIDSSYAENFYQSETSATNLDDKQINSVLERLLLAIHQYSAIEALRSVKPQSDIVRVASVAWYYGIYAACTAMVAAQEGKVQDNHTQTANSWHRQLTMRGKIMQPFDNHVTTLVKKDAEKEIDRFRTGPKTNLVHAPVSVDQAGDYIAGYLSGTRSWWEWRICENLLSSKDFKQKGITNFRTKDARTMRDARLSKQAISFMHQAFRFRGKANYREALYLAHGNSVEAAISGFVPDMSDVLKAFTTMAGAFSFKRIGSDARKMFLNDIIQKKSFSADPIALWGTP